MILNAKWRKISLMSRHWLVLQYHEWMINILFMISIQLMIPVLKIVSKMISHEKPISQQINSLD